MSTNNAQPFSSSKYYAALINPYNTLTNAGQYNYPYFCRWGNGGREVKWFGVSLS